MEYKEMNCNKNKFNGEKKAVLVQGPLTNT